MKKHKGEVIEFATRNSGYSLQEVAKRMGISRSTLYNRFGEMNINDDFIRKLSKVIHHDFSEELPYLQNQDRPQQVQEARASYKAAKNISSKELSSLQKKHCELLEAYTNLLKIAIKITTMETSELSKLQKEIITFVDQNIY
ncbi:MAG: helix-turn-helix domain-containing protein [Bacteroidota bacterium]